MYKTYSGVYSQTCNNAIEADYPTKESLIDRAIVRSEKRNFRVYKTYEQFVHELATERVKAFHEVILDLPQKLKFDIDAPASKLELFEIPTDCNVSIDDLEILEALQDFEAPKLSNAEKYQAVLDAILDAINTMFLITYSKLLAPENIVIAESHCPAGTKFSNHIIITGFYVLDAADAAEFTRRLLSILPIHYHQFLDAGVNKSLQNFRFPGCHKLESTRIKRIVSEHTVFDAIIRYTKGCEQLPKIAHAVERPDTQLMPEDAQAVIDLCANDKAFSGHKFVQTRAGFFIFTREETVDCEFCGELHHNDVRAMFATASTFNGVTTVWKYCRQYIAEHGKDGTHRRQVGVILSGDQGPAPAKMSGIAAHKLQQTIEEQPRIAPTSFETLPVQLRHIYDEPTLRPFELVQTLVVKAAMKMGKTKTLRAFIADNFTATELRKPQIRFISFRQTFSSNIKEQFPEFTLYSDIKGPLSADRLIIQVESLHRLDIVPGAEPPDLVILDECESIFEQLNSGLMRGNFSDCFAKFQYLMRYSKHLVCMDANVSDRTYRILAQMRPGFGARGTLFHWNTHKNGTDDTYYCTVDKAQWLGLLYTALEADDRVAIPISSLTEAKIIAENVARRYPAKAVKLYSSETLASEKRSHFADVNVAWAQYDVLLYTPTVSAGVSFEAAHYDKIFGYFTDESCPAETCQQMIGRIRDVSTHSYYICINATGNRGLPMTSSDIKRALVDGRSHLLNDYDKTGLTVEYTHDGRLEYRNDDYLTVWIENMRMRNLSKNYFARQLIELFRSVGATVQYIDDVFYEAQTGVVPLTPEGIAPSLLEIIQTHANIRSEIKEADCKRVSDAPDITDEQADEIRDKMIAQADITQADRAAFEKYKLRTHYSFGGAIDEKFVDTYGKPKVRRIYRNLCRLAVAPTTDEALALIKQDELETHRYLMNLGESAQNQDVNRVYVYDQHRYAIGLLRVCGWDSVDDVRFIHVATLAQTLKASEAAYWPNIRSACAEFGIKAPMRVSGGADAELVARLIAPVNKIIGIMYGARISNSKAEPDMYRIKPCKLFSREPGGSRPAILGAN